MKARIIKKYSLEKILEQAECYRQNWEKWSQKEYRKLEKNGFEKLCEATNDLENVLERIKGTGLFDERYPVTDIYVCSRDNPSSRKREYFAYTRNRRFK